MLLDLRSLWELYAKGDADSAAALDAVTQIATSGITDAGVATDAAILIGLSTAEVATASDSPTLIALQTPGDTGSGSDAISLIGTAANETAAGADAASEIALSTSDTASAVEGVSVGLSAQDTASATDTPTGINLTPAESAVAADSATLIELFAADTATAVDLGFIDHPSADEQAAGLDIAAILDLGATGDIGDTATATEFASILELIPPPPAPAVGASSRRVYHPDQRRPIYREGEQRRRYVTGLVAAHAAGAVTEQEMLALLSKTYERVA